VSAGGGKNHGHDREPSQPEPVLLSSLKPADAGPVRPPGTCADSEPADGKARRPADPMNPDRLTQTH